jgi:hypothetical protein
MQSPSISQADRLMGDRKPTPTPFRIEEGLGVEVEPAADVLVSATADQVIRSRARLRASGLQTWSS